MYTHWFVYIFKHIHYITALLFKSLVKVADFAAVAAIWWRDLCTMCVCVSVCLLARNLCVRARSKQRLHLNMTWMPIPCLLCVLMSGYTLCLYWVRSPQSRRRTIGKFKVNSMQTKLWVLYICVLYTLTHKRHVSMYIYRQVLKPLSSVHLDLYVFSISCCRSYQLEDYTF